VLITEKALIFKVSLYKIAPLSRTNSVNKMKHGYGNN